MFRKIVFALILITALVATSASAPAIDKDQPLPTWEKVFTPATPPGQIAYMLGTPTQFKGALYLSTLLSPAEPTDPQIGGQIWRSFDGKNWKAVTDTGFGIDSNHMWSWDTIVFKGKLYVPVNCMGAQANCPGTLMRSANGASWEAVTLDTGVGYLDKLGVFKDMLYATSVAFDPGQVSHIYRSRTGDQGTWETVKELDPVTTSTSSPTAYKGKVYVTGYAGESHNIIIWSSSDGLIWNTQYLRITETQDDWLRDDMLVVYNRDLYLCTLNWNDGGTIYRTKDGKNWETVFQISPTDAGFFVFAVEDMIEYKGDLYATTVYFDANIGQVGAQIWRSHSGNPGTWEKITNDADWLGAWPERGAFGTFKSQLYFMDSSGAFPAVYRMNGK